jgi:hypothetical protein
MGKALELTPHEERAVAVKVGCDPRTVRAFLEGRPQQLHLRTAIERALGELGHLPVTDIDDVIREAARARIKSKT